MNDRVEMKALPGKFRVIGVDCWEPPPDIYIKGDYDTLDEAIVSADEDDDQQSSSLAEVFDSLGTSMHKTKNLRRLEEAKTSLKPTRAT